LGWVSASRSIDACFMIDIATLLVAPVIVMRYLPRTPTRFCLRRLLINRNPIFRNAILVLRGDRRGFVLALVDLSETLQRLLSRERTAEQVRTTLIEGTVVGAEGSAAATLMLVPLLRGPLPVPLAQVWTHRTLKMGQSDYPKT
jgi:hypothetical protein